MKKNVLTIIGILLLLLTLFSCAKSENVETVAVNPTETAEVKKEKVKNKAEENYDFVKKFYTEYLMAQDKVGENQIAIIDGIKKKYLKPILIEEMEFRSRFADADAYLLTQDSTGMIDNMKVTMGKDDNWVQVSFNSKGDGQETIKTIDVHVNEQDGKKYIDAINTYVKITDSNGEVMEDRKMTKYADHELTEEDKKDIEASREYFKKCDEEGYIS